MKRFYLLFLLLPIFLCSCVEIIDDLTLNLDGSGTFKYTINLSSSKVKVNSIMALDSFNGKKVMKLGELDNMLAEFKDVLKKEKGIRSVQMEFNKADFIIKIAIDFGSIQELQNGIKTAFIKVDPKNNMLHDDGIWMSWDGKSLSRIIPNMAAERIKNVKDTEDNLLKTGTYTCISRLPRSIAKTNNVQCKLNPSKTASMLRVNALDLKLNPNLLEHTITLSP